jgi:hypothetical protein
MKGRVQTALTVLVLLAAGALMASWWLEWRHTRLDAPGSFEGVPGSPAPYGLEERVGVEVLNGAGAPGAASAYADRLRDMGFDVKTFGNASSFDQPRTVVLDRSGREGAASSVADSLGLDGALRELMPELYLDATVLLGGDWREVLAALK